MKRIRIRLFLRNLYFSSNTVVVKTRIADVGVLPVSDPAFDNKKPGSWPESELRKKNWFRILLLRKNRIRHPYKPGFESYLIFN